jgi:hypothetical protein
MNEKQIPQVMFSIINSIIVNSEFFYQKTNATAITRVTLVWPASWFWNINDVWSKCKKVYNFISKLFLFNASKCVNNVVTMISLKLVVWLSFKLVFVQNFISFRGFFLCLGQYYELNGALKAFKRFH